jgi:hypothetical protein
MTSITRRTTAIRWRRISPHTPVDDDLASGRPPLGGGGSRLTRPSMTTWRCRRRRDVLGGLSDGGHDLLEAAIGDDAVHHGVRGQGICLFRAPLGAQG